MNHGIAPLSDLISTSAFRCPGRGWADDDEGKDDGDDLNELEDKCRDGGLECPIVFARFDLVLCLCLLIALDVVE